MQYILRKILVSTHSCSIVDKRSSVITMQQVYAIDLVICSYHIISYAGDKFGDRFRSALMQSKGIRSRSRMHCFRELNIFKYINFV